MDYTECQSCGVPLPPRPVWYLPADSGMRDTAVKIMGLRMAGVEDDSIAQTLGIAKQTIHNYIYRASRNGWLDHVNPRDQVEYELIPKAVRVLHEALDDETRNEKTGVQVRQLVAMKVGENTVFKKYDNAAGQQQAPTMIAIKIEMPVSGEIPTVREGTTGGTPAYIEGEVAK